MNPCQSGSSLSDRSGVALDQPAGFRNHLCVQRRHVGADELGELVGVIEAHQLVSRSTACRTQVVT